ncbi:Iron(III) transport system substrate-binding [Candidatus Magnetaquicoccaceae bacterium FCR-1]|uniref:Iron(III) transport system substrate-binding n=1 Tax=Candidatus Magnetaquiglobus chichijimensis TaxID=3141448 RepID=A0ABQ0C545_9PROT
MIKQALIPALFLATALFGVAPVEANDELVIYSARKEHLLKPLLDAYQAKTGVKTRYLTDGEGPLLARLQAEGEATPADLLITVDAGNLWHAAEKGVLAAVDSPTLNANIPERLRDPEKRWFGLSVRARTIVHSTERVKPESLSSYEDLAAEKWKGKLCLRSSEKIYNQSLVAMLIARLGEEATEKIVRGWVANLAVPVFSNDTKLMEAIAAGKCDVGIVNTYYFGALLKEKPATPVKLFWADQKSNGTHVNVSGAGVTKHAKHRDAAIRFLEWLSTPEAQEIFAELNMEYPANPKILPHAEVAAWGTFKGESLNVSLAGRHQAAAVRLMDRAGYR